ncbi:putative holin-like toxin [Carnobacterium sp.]|nr:putative holin-like toxin [Carnobacterium sp.]
MSIVEALHLMFEFGALLLSIIGLTVILIKLNNDNKK